jgi:hypothetical protein
VALPATTVPHPTSTTMPANVTHARAFVPRIVVLSSIADPPDK